MQKNAIAEGLAEGAQALRKANDEIDRLQACKTGRQVCGFSGDMGMNDKKPEALRLADYEEAQALKAGASGSLLADELRRLHALNTELLDALKELTHSLEDEVLVHDDQRSAMQKARAAINKATGEQA